MAKSKIYQALFNTERLKEVLRVLELSQNELAEQLNMSQGGVSGTISGYTKDISIDIRNFLLKRYGINPMYFYDLSDEMYYKDSIGKLNNVLKELKDKDKEIAKLNRIIDLQDKELQKEK